MQKYNFFPPFWGGFCNFSQGVGLSYGYSWVLGKHWNIEATIGAGYLYLESDIYPCTHCGTKREKVKKHYVGPTQAALSAVYVF